MYANWGRDGNQKIDLIIRTYTYWSSNCFTDLTYRDPVTGKDVHAKTHGGYGENTSAKFTIERSTHLEPWVNKPDADLILPFTVYRYDAIFQNLPVDTPMSYSVKCDERPPCWDCSHPQMAKNVRIHTPVVEKHPSPDRMRRFGFVVIGDLWKGVRWPTKQVVSGIENLWLQGKVDFILGAGDISNLEGESADYYSRVYQYYKRLALSIPIFSVAGNHDYYTDSDGHSFFKLANVPPRARADGRPWPEASLTIRVLMAGRKSIITRATTPSIMVI